MKRKTRDETNAEILLAVRKILSAIFELEYRYPHLRAHIRMARREVATLLGEMLVTQELQKQGVKLKKAKVME